MIVDRFEKKKKENHPEYYNFVDKKCTFRNTEAKPRTIRLIYAEALNFLHPGFQTGYRQSNRHTASYKNTVENTTPLECRLH